MPSRAPKTGGPGGAGVDTVAPGDFLDEHITADAWNDLMELRFEWLKGAVRDLKRKIESPRYRLSTRVKVRNKTQNPLKQFEIVKLDKAITDPSKSATHLVAFQDTTDLPLFDAVVPELDGSSFAVVQSACPKDSICEAIIRGVTRARVFVHDPLDTHAALIPTDVNKFDSVPGGGIGKMLWKEDGGGLKWAYVDIQPDFTGYSVVTTSIITAAQDVGGGVHQAGTGTCDIEWIDRNASNQFKPLRAGARLYNNCTFPVPAGVRGQAKPTPTGILFDVECCLEEGGS